MPAQLRRQFYVGGLMLFASLSMNAAKPEKPDPNTLVIESNSVKANQPVKTQAIHYQLPKNYVQFAFKLKTTTQKQGAYCDVAGYFFELPPKFDCKHTDPTFKVGLADQIIVSQLAEPDPAAAFDLNVKNGTFTETNLTLGFGDANILTGAQGSVTDHKVDFFMSILKTAATIVSHIIPLALAAPPPPLAMQETNPRATPLENAHQPEPADCASQLDEQERPLYNRLGPAHKAFACHLRAELRSAYLAIPDQYKAYADAYKRDKHSFDSHFANALALFIEYSALNADEARFLRPDRLPVNYDAFAGVLKAREDKKQAIRQQFFGAKDESVDDVPVITWHFSADKEVELFSFDAQSEGGYCFRTAVDERWAARPIGVDKCDTSSPTLIGVYAIMRKKNEAEAKDPKEVKDQTAAEQAPDSSTGQPGVAYRNPGRGELRVFARRADGSEFDYFSAGFDIAQFGCVRFLPTKIGSSSSYNFALDPLTGALKNVTIGAKAKLSGDTGKQIDDVTSSVLGIVDAVQNAKKKPTALETAQSEQQLKFEQLKIQMIESCKTDPTQSFCATLFK